MKILFTSSSMTRNFPLAFISLNKYILSKLGKDLYITASFKKTKTEDENFVKKCFSSVTSNNIIKFEKDDPIDSNLNPLFQNMDPSAFRSGTKGIILQWKSLAKLKHLISSATEKWGDFDLVIWARPDLFYFTYIENLEVRKKSFFHSNTLYFPQNDYHRGINDRFCMGKTESILLRMDIYDYFVNSWAPKNSKTPNWNPEMVLLDLIKEKKINIKYTSVSFGKLREDHVSIPVWAVEIPSLVKKIPKTNRFFRLLKLICLNFRNIFNLIKIELIKSYRYPNENIRGFPLKIAIKKFLKE